MSQAVGGAPSQASLPTTNKNKNKGKSKEFPHRVLKLDEVRSVFSRTQCCDSNCMETLFCMPVDPLAGGNVVSIDRHSAAARAASTTNADNDEYGSLLRMFESKLKAVRSQSQPFRSNTDDPHAMVDFLVHHFTEKRSPSSGRWIYDLHIGGTHLIVCRTTWMGVFGVTQNELEYAQGLVRSGTDSRVRLNPKDAIKTKKAIFLEFGLNVDDYHRHLRAAVDYNEVPDKARYHIAVAFLTDFVDYCGEYQPDDESWHIDSMDIKEVWQDYASDETVVRLTNLERCANELLSQKELNKLWTSAFRRVHIRFWKGITGRDNLAVHVL